MDAEADVDAVAEDADADVADSPRKPYFFVLYREMLLLLMIKS